MKTKAKRTAEQRIKLVNDIFGAIVAAYILGGIITVIVAYGVFNIVNVASIILWAATAVFILIDFYRVCNIIEYYEQKQE